MLTLYYHRNTCATASHICLEESGLDYVAVPAPLWDEEGSDAYLRINPLGKVPSLVIGSDLLTENWAIMNYVADQVPEKGFLPKPGTLERARASEWFGYLSSTVHINFRQCFRPTVFTKDGQDAEAIRAKGFDNVAASLATIEGRLQGRDFALGDHFSFCDAYLFVFYRWSQAPMFAGKLPDTPTYHAIMTKVQGRPSIQRVLARELS